MDADSWDVVAAAVKSFVDTMLDKYMVVGSPSEAGGTSDAPDDEVPLASGGDAQV